jgi:hypothetical protein
MRFGVEVEWTAQSTVILSGRTFVLPARLSSDVRPLETSEMWLLEIVLDSEIDRRSRCLAQARFVLEEAPRGWRSPGTELDLWEGSTRVATLRVLRPRLSVFSHLGRQPLRTQSDIPAAPSARMAGAP